MKKYIFAIIGLIILGIFSIYKINMYVLSFSQLDYYQQIEQLPYNEVGLVFGASVINNKTPSTILKDRLFVAAEAYKQGKIGQIIVSGDNSQINYNEPDAMKSYLIEQGVKADDIHPDYAGFDTYDTLYRARDLFYVKDVTLFTQDFHLYRALYISKRLGMNPIAMEANRHVYFTSNYNRNREILARVKAFLDIEILKSKPKFLGEPLRISSKEEIELLKQDLTREEE